MSSPALRATSACPVRAVPSAFASLNRTSQTFASAGVKGRPSRSQRRRSARRTVRPGRIVVSASRPARAERVPRPVERLHPAAISRRVALHFLQRQPSHVSPPSPSCPSWGRRRRGVEPVQAGRRRRERLSGRVERSRRVGHNPVTVLFALEQDSAGIVRHEQIGGVGAVFQLRRTAKGCQVQPPVGRSVALFCRATADATSTAAPASQKRRSTVAAVSSCSRLSFAPSPTVKR